MSAGPLSGRTRVAAVLGWPVAHSASPAIHNAAFAALGIDAVFVALPVAPEDLAGALGGLRALGFLGASVTVPHKETVLALCDRLDDSARRIGAVNCIELPEEGGVVGHNTDAAGFADALERELSLAPAGLRAVLLGGGGAARAIAAGLLERGAGSVTAVARRPERVDFCPARPFTAESLAGLLPHCDLLVDCTPTALSGGESELPAPVPLELLAAPAAVASLVYHREPGLLARARARGLKTMDGAAMLIHQGARAFEIWTGRPAPIEAMTRALPAPPA